MQCMQAPCPGRLLAARHCPIAGLPATHTSVPLRRQRAPLRRCERVQMTAVARGAGMGGEPDGGAEGGNERRRGRGGGPGGDGGGSGGGDRPPRQEDDGFQERVVQVRRVTKVVKGGKQLSFRAVVVVGDENGSVGVGCAAAKEVVTAVQKAVLDGKRSLVKVPLNKNNSFPHRIDGYFGAAKVMLRPAAEGTGVIAGGAVRVVLELAGVKNAFGKQLGSDSPLNNARATLTAISGMRTFKEVSSERGISVQELMGLNQEKKAELATA